MKRILGRTVAGLIVALVILYVGDWSVWRLRVARGGGMGSAVVSNIVGLPLKDNKEEYDWGGTGRCELQPVHLSPGGSGACWWLRRA